MNLQFREPSNQWHTCSMRFFVSFAHTRSQQQRARGRPTRFAHLCNLRLAPPYASQTSPTAPIQPFSPVGPPASACRWPAACPPGPAARGAAPARSGPARTSRFGRRKRMCERAQKGLGFPFCSCTQNLSASRSWGVFFCAPLKTRTPKWGLSHHGRGLPKGLHG